VTHDVLALVGPTGVIRTAELAARVDRHTIARWVRAGRLVRLHPGVLVVPERTGDWPTRALAGVLATKGARSHMSALAVWRLVPRAGQVHVSVPASRRALRSPGLVVHRVARLDVDRIGGLPVTTLPRGLVDAWGLAHGAGSRDAGSGRGPVLEALRDRRVTAAQLYREMAGRPALPGRRELTRLIALVEQGCRSELEIWGVRHVLHGPGMPRFAQQFPVRLPFAVVHLDAAVPELRVAIELDGAAFHGSAEDRERDTRRDVARAALGWVVLRFSYRRLTREPAACRAQILAIYRQRLSLVR
jgi:very-short-patch-repair endonuclease